MLNLIGVYKWTNLINNKVYIGCSIKIKERWKQHEYNSKQKHKDSKFYRAIKKYGIDNFKKEVIELCTEIVLEQREEFYINSYNSIKNGYNINIGYNTITHNPKKKEICKKISDKAKNRKWVNNCILNKTIDKKKSQHI